MAEERSEERSEDRVTVRLERRYVGSGSTDTSMFHRVRLPGPSEAAVVADFNALSQVTVISSPSYNLTKSSFSLEANPDLAKVLLGSKLERSLEANPARETVRPGSKLGPSIGFESFQFVLRTLREWRAKVQKQTAADRRLRQRYARFHYNQPLKNYISDNNGIFEGFGDHEACEVCFFALAHPAEPVWQFCEDDLAFERMVAYLHYISTDKYIQDYVRTCFPSSTHLNPFHFSAYCHRRFMERYCSAYYKERTLISLELFVRLWNSGLLDPDHVIGQPYDPKPLPDDKSRAISRQDSRSDRLLSKNPETARLMLEEPSALKFDSSAPLDLLLECGRGLRKTFINIVRLVVRAGSQTPFVAFTPIVAKPPIFWKYSNAELQYYGDKWKDARDWGFTACIGPQDFHYRNSTRLWFDIEPWIPAPRNATTVKKEKDVPTLFWHKRKARPDKVKMIRNPASILISGRNRIVRTGRTGHPARLRIPQVNLRHLSQSAKARMLRAFSGALHRKRSRRNGLSTKLLYELYEQRFQDRLKRIRGLPTGVLQSPRERREALIANKRRHELLRVGKPVTWNLVPSMKEIGRLWPNLPSATGSCSSLSDLTTSEEEMTDDGSMMEADSETIDQRIANMDMDMDMDGDKDEDMDWEDVNKE